MATRKLPMVYSAGDCARAAEQRLRSMGWGQVWSVGPARPPRLPFVLDNGAYKAWTDGAPFPAEKFLHRLGACYEHGWRPDFVVLPDVVADREATLRLSAEWHPIIPDGWRRYFALQDGIERVQVAAFTRRCPIDGVFLGGTNWFKDAHAFEWCAWAHDHGVKFHYGRCGTKRKIEHAIAIGADSLDSVCLVRAAEFEMICRIMRNPHPRLFEEGGAHGTH